MSETTQRCEIDARLLSFQSLQTGALFAARYRICEVLGAGGAGEVYRAEDEVGGIPVALKILFPGRARQDLERLRREVTIVRALQAPGILRVFDIGSADGLLYVVSEYLHGETLLTRIRREGALDPAAARRIIRGVLEALSVAHDSGVVHRDVKPGNVFLTRGDSDVPDRIVLLDFGLAKSADALGLTTVGRFVGTPEYCSPEQARGDAAIAAATDLYAAGITLWEMLAGSTPFHGDSDLSVLNAHLTMPLPDPWVVLAEAPRDLRYLTVKLLEKSPGRRPSSARAAIGLLDRDSWIVDRCLRLALWSRNRPARLLWSTAVLVLLAVGGLWSLEPTDVHLDGRRVRWTTRLGIQTTSDPLPDAVAHAVVEPRGFGALKRTWIALGPGTSRPPQSSVADGHPLVYSASTPFSEPLPWGMIRTQELWRRVYPGIENPFVPRAIISLGPVQRPNEARLALIAEQTPSYPCAVTMLLADGDYATYYHPGYIQSLTPFRRSSDGNLQLIGLAKNNLVGPRHVLFSIPATPFASGQAPPYAADPKHFPRSGGWYWFLPQGGQYGNVSVRLEEGHGFVDLPPHHSIEFDLETGVPAAPEYRGGLTEETWVRRQKALLDALWYATGLAWTSPENAADTLERVAGSGTGSPEQTSVALYRAALLRMRSTQSEGDQGYVRALEDVSLALQHDPEPSRYRLLRAELLVRLGRNERAAAALATWGRQREEQGQFYDWYVVNQMAGSPLDAGRFLTLWETPEQPTGGAHLLALMLRAYRDGGWDEPMRLLEDFHHPPDEWAIHGYWAARAALDRPEPDPVLALRALDQADSRLSEGTILPLLPARLHAISLVEPTRIREVDLEAADAQVRALEVASATDLRSLYHLSFARRDLSEARAVFTSAYTRKP